MYVVVFCGVFEQQKIYVVLSASFGTEIFYCEAFCIGFEREDVDADGGVLFLEEGDLFGLNGIIYSTHVQCGFVFNVVGHALFVNFRFVRLVVSELCY